MGIRITCDECWNGENHETGKTCTVCDGTGDMVVPDNQIVYVNVYSIERCYGGPEEGGWWYNWFNCIESYPCRNEVSDLMQEQLEKEYNHIKHGDIYSVLGGTDLAVYIEQKPAESQTKERPYYE